MEKKKRTKLKDRTLPDYTRGEEIFNMVSHIVGGALAIAALVLCVIFSALKGDPWAVVASAVYGGKMCIRDRCILLYTKWRCKDSPGRLDTDRFCLCDTYRCRE